MKYLVKFIAYFRKIYIYAMMGFIVYAIIIVIYSLFNGVEDIILRINK